MSALIGALRVTLGLETAAFEKGANLAQKQAAALGKRMGAMGDKLTGLGTKLSLGLTAPFAGLMATAIPAAIESREALAQVEAGLKSMGGASGKTAEELKKSARELQRLSTFDDDEILRKVTSNLITFGNVSGDVFDRAQRAALDLSARLGQDLQSSAIQIGKALNDPIKGVTALSRVGVSFTADQKEMIKAMVEVGDVAGAQKLILSELEKQYGGSAKAARDAAPGSDVRDAWSDFQETIGEIALKVLPPLTNILTKVLDAFNNLSPATQTLVIGIAAFGAAVGPVLIVVGSLLKIVGSLGPALTVLTKAWAALKIGMLAAKAAALATLPALTPFLIPLAAIAAAVGAVYLAWRNWDKITAIVQRMVTGVTAWLDKLRAPFDWVVDKTKKVGDAFFKLYDRVVGHSYVPDMVDGIEDEFARLDDVMVKPALDATATVGNAFAELERRAPLEEWLARIPKTAGEIKAELQDIATYGFDSLADAIAGAIAGTRSLKEAFRSMAQAIIADIVRMIVRMIIARTLMSALGMGGGGNPFKGVDFGSFPKSGPPGLALGGSFAVKGFRGIDQNLLSLNGLPVAKVSHGERVSVDRRNQSGGGEMVVHVNASPELDVRIERVSGRVVTAAAPLIVRASTMNIARSMNRPRLG